MYMNKNNVFIYLEYYWECQTIYIGKVIFTQFSYCLTKSFAVKILFQQTFQCLEQKYSLALFISSEKISDYYMKNTDCYTL